MRRLKLFAKGNVDVHDSLIYSRVNGRIQWNGLNTLLAESHPGLVARVRHEPCARWDLTGIGLGEIPDELITRALPLGSFALETQYQSQLLEHDADVVVLSIQSDITNRLWRHRRDGYQFFAPALEEWRPQDRIWLEENFSQLNRTSPEAAMNNLSSLVSKIRARSNPSILVYNTSAVVPGEAIVTYRGLEDALSTRIRAFNLALIETAATLDVSVVDVDHAIARAGADRVKLDTWHYIRDGYRLLAAEVVRILEALGHLDT
jgi:hypothetical protein